MELGYNAKAAETRSMEDSARAVYERMCKVVCVHAKLNELAMSATQALGYNGFKRWHRHRARRLFDCKLRLMNDLFDKFRVRPEIGDYEVTYAPKTLEEHLKSWEKALLSAIEEVGEANKEYFALAGTRCELADELARCFAHDFEKVGRYIRRFNESDWLALDMHIVDDRLHDKYKRKEEEGRPWNMTGCGFASIR